MEILDKYIWLIEILSESPQGLTYREIKDRWDRSRNMKEEGELQLRTFHRYRDNIEAAFCIIIDCKHNRYFISNRKEMDEDYIRQWLFNTYSINNLVGKNGQLRKRILFDEIPSGRYFLTDVIEAMRDNKKMDVSYRKYCYDENKEYVLKPYFVKSFKKRWYMIAFDEEANMVKVFSMDRVTNLFITDEKFKMPKNFHPQTYFDDCFGIINDNRIPVDTIRIKVYNDQHHFLEDLPLHPSQRTIKRTDDYVIFEYDMKVTFDLIQEVMSHGEDWEVLKPKSLREEISKRIKIMNNLYK